jgi:hypothetical protein
VSELAAFVFEYAAAALDGVISRPKVSEVAAFLLALGQQVWQQQEGKREEEATVCFLGLAPFLLAAAAIGLRSLQRSLRRLAAPTD